MNASDIAQLLMALLGLLVWGLAFTLIAVLAILNLRSFRKHYKTGLLIGMCCFVLLIPSLAFKMAYFDADVVVDRMADPGTPREMTRLMLQAGLAIGVLLYVVRIGWYMIVYYVAASEWTRMEPDAFPLLRRTGSASLAPLAGALGLGAAAGVLSTVAMKALHVDIGEAVKNMMLMFTGAESASLAVRAPVVLVSVAVIGVVEELLFRGAMLGFLLRVFGRSRLSFLLSAVVVSLLWALLHLQNTNAPLIKCAQFFLIGLLFCWLARKGRIESAMAAHVGLNLAAATAALAMP